MRLQPSSLSSLNWLPSLKAAQLQRVAFLTGVSSSGTKPVLIERLTAALSSPFPALISRSGRRAKSKQDATCGKAMSNEGQLSILSLDMGIRNLAYAHLLVQPERNDGQSGGRFSPLQLPILNAWNRLAISEFPNSLIADTPVHLPMLVKSTSDGAIEMEKNLDAIEPTKTITKQVAAESFAPELYAGHAYTLITSLIAAYQPTHILIERQRFRSGGGAAVQEWTIRVGVFEGMLYAVLYTLQQESKSNTKIAVQAVEPQRVARYWIETGPTAIMSTSETKKRTSSKEGKKNKIELVGRWLSSAAAANGEQTGIGSKVSIQTPSQAEKMAAAYLHKWGKGRKGKPAPLTSTSSTKHATVRRTSRKEEKDVTSNRPDVAAVVGATGDIKKLDDLADCLLQGVAWLEWQRMKERIAVEGVAALGDI